MKVIRADQEATGDMFDAASRITRLASLWSAMRDAAPTLDAVPVEELRELADTFDHIGARCAELLRALIAKHSGA